MNPATNYRFTFKEEFLSPTPRQIRRIHKNLGHKIDKSYKNPENHTPHKVQNAVLFGLTAGSALLFPPVALLLGGFTLLHYFQTDYDSFEERRKIVRSIAKDSFEAIASSHHVDKVIGYKLLDKVSLVSVIDVEQREFFYGAFKNLADEYERLKKWRSEQEGVIIDKWHDETKMFHEELTTTAAQKAMKPWNQWKDHQISKVKEVYQNSIKVLEDKFIELKNPSHFHSAYEEFQERKNSESFLSSLW